MNKKTSLDPARLTSRPSSRHFAHGWGFRLYSSAAVALALLSPLEADAQSDLLQCTTGTLCGNVCVDTARDAQHCGACGVSCGAGASCQAGACVQPVVLGAAESSGGEVSLQFGGGGIIRSEDYPVDGYGLEGGFGRGIWASLAIRGRNAAGSSYGIMIGRVAASSPGYEVSALGGVRGGLDARLRLARVGIGAHALSVYIPGQAGFLWWRATREVDDFTLSILDFYVRVGVGAEFTLASSISFGFEFSTGIRAGINANAEYGDETYDLFENEDPDTGETVGGRVSVAPWLLSLTATYHWGSAPPPPVPSPVPRTSPEILALILSQHATDAEGLSVEVTATERFRDAFENYRHVALVAPTRCINESAAVASGSAHSREEVLGTQCGVEMAELERTLAQANYRVTSWRTMADAMARGGQTAVDVARSLGAQVVFQVNSLERSLAEARFIERANWSFHQTDVSGATGPQIAVSAADAERLRQIANAYLARQHQGTTGHAATLDVVAIDVASSGESVWFYRGQLVEELSSNSDVRIAVRGTPRAARQGEPEFDWAAIETPQPAGAHVVVPATSSGGSQTTAYGGGPTDPTRALEQRIMRTLVADFVQRFRTGTAGTAP